MSVLTLASDAAPPHRPGKLGHEEAPWFCHGIACPRFSTLNHTEAWDARTYHPAVWVSTRVSGTGYDKAVETGFMRLFDYISGRNEQGIKIPMTAPVRTSILPSAGPFCENDFTVSFFVPPEHQAAPPTPTDPSVFIEKEGDHTVYYVASYPGYSSDHKVIDHAAKLVDQLTLAGVHFSAEEFFSAAYDSPFRLLNRHNEVWIPATRPQLIDAPGLPLVRG